MPAPFSLDDAQAGSGDFFVPADGVGPDSRNEKEAENDEPPQTVLQVLCESFVAQGKGKVVVTEAKKVSF